MAKRSFKYPDIRSCLNRDRSLDSHAFCLHCGCVFTVSVWPSGHCPNSFCDGSGLDRVTCADFQDALEASAFISEDVPF